MLPQDLLPNVQEYLEAIQRGDVAKVEAMLDEGLVKPIQEQCLKSWSDDNQDYAFQIDGGMISEGDPLMLAIYCDQFEVVRFFVERDWPLDYHVFNSEYQSPLCYARGALLRYLVEQGMEANAYCLSGSVWGDSPLYRAKAPDDALFLLQHGASPLDDFQNDPDFQKGLWEKRGQPGWDAVAHHIFVAPPIEAATLKNVLRYLDWPTEKAFSSGTLGSPETGHVWYRRYLEAAYAYALQIGDAQATERLAIFSPRDPQEWEDGWPTDPVFPDES